MIYAAITAAQAAGERLRQAFGHHLTVNATYAHDIKLAADVECQDLIYSILLDHFPKTRCIGEEGDSNNPGDPNAEVEWIVDPIDGTMNLAHGIPHFCVSIAAREAATAEGLAALEALAGGKHTTWRVPLAPTDPSARDVARWLLAEGAA